MATKPGPARAAEEREAERLSEIDLAPFGAASGRALAEDKAGSCLPVMRIG